MSRPTVNVDPAPTLRLPLMNSQLMSRPMLILPRPAERDVVVGVEDVDVAPGGDRRAGVDPVKRDPAHHRRARDVDRAGELGRLKADDLADGPRLDHDVADVQEGKVRRRSLDRVGQAQDVPGVGHVDRELRGGVRAGDDQLDPAPAHRLGADGPAADHVDVEDVPVRVEDLGDPAAELGERLDERLDRDLGRRMEDVRQQMPRLQHHFPAQVQPRPERPSTPASHAIRHPSALLDPGNVPLGDVTTGPIRRFFRARGTFGDHRPATAPHASGHPIGPPLAATSRDRPE